MTIYNIIYICLVHERVCWVICIAKFHKYTADKVKTQSLLLLAAIIRFDLLLRLLLLQFNLLGPVFA